MLLGSSNYFLVPMGPPGPLVLEVTTTGGSSYFQ